MNETVFKNESIDKLSSPEELNDYIKVTSPSIWIILAAVIILLFGAVIWGIFGTVSIIDENGVQKNVSPISFVIN